MKKSLWHPLALSCLPGTQLLHLHCNLCSYRARPSKKFGEVVYNAPLKAIADYHELVINEMVDRNWKPNLNWKNPYYRGPKQFPIREGLLLDLPLTYEIPIFTPDKLKADLKDIEVNLITVKMSSMDRAWITGRLYRMQEIMGMVK